MFVALVLLPPDYLNKPDMEHECAAGQDAPDPEGRQPQVAILLAVHAGADPSQLDDALVSMRDQTHCNLRLFVYADGPLHDTHEAVLSRRLRLAPDADCVVRGERPVGLPAGLNRLIDLAVADTRIAYMARMDGDDISTPTRIERQIAFLREHPQVSIVGTWCIEFSEPGVPLFHKQLPTQADEIRRFMLYRSPLAHPTVMFRREVFEAGQRYSPSMKIMQDYEFWARLLAAGYIISNVPEYLLWYRMAEGFYGRRAGLHRAWGEVKLRWRYARAASLLRPQHLFGFLGLFLVRMSPEPIKRIAYKHLR